MVGIIKISNKPFIDNTKNNRYWSYVGPGVGQYAIYITQLLFA